MPPEPLDPPSCSIYLVTPPLSAAAAPAFARVFAEVVGAVPVASARVRFESGAEGEARAIVAPLLECASGEDCALILDGDPRRVARLGADGAHVEGPGDALDAALGSSEARPDRGGWSAADEG